jgi:hypothetical protein
LGGGDKEDLEFETSQGYIVKPCLEKIKANKQISKNNKEITV